MTPVDNLQSLRRLRLGSPRHPRSYGAAAGQRPSVPSPQLKLRATKDHGRPPAGVVMRLIENEEQGNTLLVKIEV
eukprot:CAMPEP_0185189438 /NCGR_PEP_ID=MMETSP1140-20130426/6037_1 /TAXON_ID=298111 /ORGANISM="Pavlova sp., Strain CCMP459" /LENGTH=74 /DNA_ID=CAMNT_0027755999 /DNA_START=306 /DNA_END=530 /DNA_ORIENTATION=-